MLVSPRCDEKICRGHAVVNSLFTPASDAVLSVPDGMQRPCTAWPSLAQPSDAQLGQGFKASYIALGQVSANQETDRLDMNQPPMPTVAPSAHASDAALHARMGLLCMPNLLENIAEAIWYWFCLFWTNVCVRQPTRTCGWHHTRQVRWAVSLVRISIYGLIACLRFCAEKMLFLARRGVAEHEGPS